MQLLCGLKKRKSLQRVGNDDDVHIAVYGQTQPSQRPLLQRHVQLEKNSMNLNADEQTTEVLGISMQRRRRVQESGVEASLRRTPHARWHL